MRMLAPCFVIASAAKQSNLPPRRDSGLLPPSLKLRRTSRCARNDDVERVCATLRSRAGRRAASLRRCVAALPGHERGRRLVLAAEYPTASFDEHLGAGDDVDVGG